MAKLRFHADGEHLPVEACPELVAEFDGIRYRAKVTEANARMFRAQLLEPFTRTIYVAMPIFVIAMSSFRLVRVGQPTAELLRLLHSKMEAIHGASLTQSALEAALAIEGTRLHALAREERDRLVELEKEENLLLGLICDLGKTISRERSKIRREIQKGVKEGRYRSDEGLHLLQDQEAIEKALATLVGAKLEELRGLEDRLAEVRACADQAERRFCSQTGFCLEDVERHWSSR